LYVAIWGKKSDICLSYKGLSISSIKNDALH
jgi:hypothetical protein